jgi:hypothetical protein
MSGPKPQPLVDRIHARIERAGGGCWNWTGYVSPDGYGRIKVGRTTENAHRVAYRVLVGEFDPVLHVDHLCRNRRCVNPAHLEPVTIRENQLRGPGSATHCKHGHPRIPENTQKRADGRRICKVCHRTWARDSWRRRHAKVGMEGLEPSRPQGHDGLSAARLPSFATSPSADDTTEEES